MIPAVFPAALCLCLAGCAPQSVPVTAPPRIDAATNAASLSGRTLEAPALREFLTANFGAVPAEWDFESLAWVAFFYHPALDTARAQWAASQAAHATAAARPNPSLTLVPGVSSNPPSGVSPWLPAINLEFLFETAGKRDRRAAAAAFESEASRLTVLATAWQVRSDLRRALLDLTAAQARLPTLTAQRDAQREVATRLEQRRAAGAVDASAVATARLALLKFEDALASAELQAMNVRSRLAAALGVPRSALDGAKLAADLFPGGSPLTGEELTRARATALHARADVLAALAKYEATCASFELELRRRQPDVRLGPGYQWDQGESKWTVAFGFELPLFHRNEGPLAEAAARCREAATQLTATQARVLAAIDEGLAAQAMAAAQFDRARQLRGEASQQLDRARGRITAGAGDRLEAAAAELELQAANLALTEAKIAQANARGQIEDALQIPFTASERVAPKPSTVSQ